MRIILLVVFYIAAYAARITAGGVVATIPGSSVKHVLKQQTTTTHSRVSEVPVDDGMTRKAIKRGRQSLLVNRIDGFLQTRRVPNGRKLIRVRRSSRRRTKQAQDSGVSRRRNDLENNGNDTDVDYEWSNTAKLRGPPVWQVSELSVPATTKPTFVGTKNLKNRDSARSSRIDEAIFPLTRSNPQEMLYELPEVPPRGPMYVLSYLDRYSDVKNGNFALPRTPSLESSFIEPGDASHARFSRTPIKRVLVPVYRLGTLAETYSPKSSNWYQEDPLTSYSSNEEKSRVDDNRPRESSFRKFLLVPMTKDLYVLKDVDEDSGPPTANDNATSAILAFKAHLHHDVKDVGKAYLRGRLLTNQQLPEHVVNQSLPDLEPGVFQEEDSAESSTSSYSNFLYSGVSPQTYSSSIDTLSETFEEEIVPQVMDYGNTSFVNNGVNLDAEVGLHDQSKSSSTSSFDLADYDLVSSSLEDTDSRRSRVSPAIELNGIDQLGLSGGDFEVSRKYDEFDVESTTVDLLDLLGTLNVDVDKLITVGDAEVYTTDNDRALYTTEAYSLGNLNEHTTSKSISTDAEEESTKEKQDAVQKSRALLKAIKPLSSELQRLLSAVKLVNQSISDVQNRLCDKKNVVGSRKPKRDNEEEEKATNIANSINDAGYYNPVVPNRNLIRRFRRKKRIKSALKGAEDTKLQKRSGSHSLFFNKLTTPFRRRSSLIGDSGIMGGNSLKEASAEESPEFDTNSPRLRLNRNLKSLMKSREAPGEPIGRLAGLKERIPAIVSSGLDEDDLTGDFLERRVQHYPRYNSRPILLSNNKRDVEQLDTTTSTRTHQSPVDPELYSQATAYLELLNLLNTSEGAGSTTPAVMKPLLSPTTELVTDITATFPLRLPKETPTTASGVTTPEELPEEETESMPLETDTTEVDYYEGIGENYTDIYDEDENVTSWYEFTDTTVKTGKVGAVIEDKTTRTTGIGITEVGITPNVEIMETTTVIPISEGFTVESTMLLTPLLEGVTGITLKITIPAVTETPFVATPSVSTVNIVSKETTLSMSTETVATTSGSSMPEEEESPVTQIEKTITAEETTTTESPTTTEAPGTTETPTTTETSTVSETPTSETAETPTGIKTPTTTKKIATTTKTPAATKIPTTTKVPTTIKPIAVSTTIKTPTAIKTTSIKFSNTTKIPTTVTIPTTSEALTTAETVETSEGSTTIESTTTELSTTIKETSIKFSNTTKIPTTVTIPTTSETLTTVETVETSEGSTTIESITTELSTTIETPETTESLTTPETFMSTETLTTSEIETTTMMATESTAVKIPKITETPITRTTSTIETSTILSTFSSETTGNITTTTTPLTEGLETTTKGITATTSTATTEEEEFTTSVITEEAIEEVTTSAIYPSSSTTPFTVTTMETTSPINETVTSPFTPTITAVTSAVTISTTTTEEISISTTEEVTSANFTTIPEETVSTEEEISGVTFTTSPIEEISMSTEATWVSTERSTVSTVENIRTSASFMPSTISVTEIITTSTMLPEITTEVTETSTSATSVTLLSTTERPEEVPEMSTTETSISPIESTSSSTEIPATKPKVTSVSSKTVSEAEEVATVSNKIESTRITKTTAHFITSTPVATTEEASDIETEYYVDKALEEQAEEEEEEEEEKEAEEEYDTEIPIDEWRDYDEYETTTKAITTTTSSTVNYSKLSEEGMTTLEIATTISTTEFTASTASKKEETAATEETFGSTEEYTLPSSTVSEIMTEPLESLTIPPKYTYKDRLEPVTEPVTEPEDMAHRKSKKPTSSTQGSTLKHISTGTEVPAEKSTIVFVSPALTTLSEEKLMHSTTIPPFTAPEVEGGFTTVSKIGEEMQGDQKKRLQQQLDELKRHEKEMTEREERLKERELQWEQEKKKRKEKLMQHMEEEGKKSMTVLETAESTTSTPTETEAIGTESLTGSTVIAFEATSPALETTFATLPMEETEKMYKYATKVTEAGLTSVKPSTFHIVEEVLTTSYESFFTSTTEETWTTGAESSYDEEIESLKEQLREKQRDLKEREKMLLEREQRLEEDMGNFDKYLEKLESGEIGTSTISSEESTVTSEGTIALGKIATPVPPTEKISSVKAGVTVPAEKTTEFEGKKRTEYISEEAVTPREEEEIVTKRICLNVLANTSIPYEKLKRNAVAKKFCLPYFPERKPAKRSVGRLGRKILAFQVAKEIAQSNLNLPLYFRHGKRRRRVEEAVRKMNKLWHHDWLTNKTTKSLRYFKGFTRMYEGTRRAFPKEDTTVTDVRKSISNFRATTSPYERHVLDRHESSSQLITSAMSSDKKYWKRYVFPGSNPIRKRESDPSNNNDDVTVGEEYETMTFTSEPNGEQDYEDYTDDFNESGEDGKTAENYADYEPEEKNDVKETHSDLPGKTEKEEDNEEKKEIEKEKEVTEKEKTEEDEHKEAEEEKEVTEKEKMEEDEHEEAEEEKEVTEKEKTEEDEHNEAEEEKEVTEKEKTEEDEHKEAEEEKDEEEDDYGRTTSAEKILVDPSKLGILVGKQKELMDQAWPTENSSTYYLGSTRYSELEPRVTETTDTFGTTVTAAEADSSSLAKTTCLYVVLKNESNHARMKRNRRHREANLHLSATSLGERDNFFKNTTSRRVLRNKKPRTKRNTERKEVTKLNEFPNTDDGLSKTMRGRKLFAINDSNKPKHRVAKHKSTKPAKRNDKKAKLAKLKKSRNKLHASSSIRETNNCVTNKKKPDQHKKMMAKESGDDHARTKNNVNGKNEGKLARRDIIVAESKNEINSASRTENCAGCICNLVDVINHVKTILDRLSYPLDEIKALNCSRYKETGNKIVISTDFDVEEDARTFPQPRYNAESLKGQRYIKPEDLEGDPKSDLTLENDRDIISLPGLNLNVPCNRDGDSITWLSSVSRPSYVWKRTDGIALYGFVAENGDLELRNVNAKDTGNYTCVVTYMGADNEEPVEATYEVRLRVVTLPRYILHGEGRYRVRFCDERGLDALATYLPLKLNNVLCEADICNAYLLTPSCSRSQITMNVLVVPSHILKLTTIDHKHCNVFCLKAIQDKLSLMLSENLQTFLEKSIIFRLPHFEQKLLPIAEKPSFARRRRGRSDGSGASEDGIGNDIGLFSTCPAGYGLRGTHCVPCDVDTYSEDGISRCKRCPPGTYQPNHGASICRTCTSPLTRGCYNMLWNSFSAVMVTLASFSVMLSIFLILLWMTCCAKKKFCAKRIISVISVEDACKQEGQVEELPLIKDVSENEDQQWNGEHGVKRKRRKYNVNRKRRKQSEKRYEKTRMHEDEWGSHRIMDMPINCLDSYRSHEDYNNYYPKQSYRKGPRLPERDFDT